jgi:hypothetical protein
LAASCAADARVVLPSIIYLLELKGNRRHGPGSR